MYSKRFAILVIGNAEQDTIRDARQGDQCVFDF
jgi:hypothetical protein